MTNIIYCKIQSDENKNMATERKLSDIIFTYQIFIGSSPSFPLFSFQTTSYDFLACLMASLHEVFIQFLN